MTIEAAHYEETRRALILDPIVGRMAADVLEYHGTAAAALEAIAHPDRATPRHGFMAMANDGYRANGGTIEDRHLGAVGEAIIRILTVFTERGLTDHE